MWLILPPEPNCLDLSGTSIVFLPSPAFSSFLCKSTGFTCAARLPACPLYITAAFHACSSFASYFISPTLHAFALQHLWLAYICAACLCINTCALQTASFFLRLIPLPAQNNMPFSRASLRAFAFSAFTQHSVHGAPNSIQLGGMVSCFPRFLPLAPAAFAFCLYIFSEEQKHALHLQWHATFTRCRLRAPFLGGCAFALTLYWGQVECNTCMSHLPHAWPPSSYLYALLQTRAFLSPLLLLFWCFVVNGVLLAKAPAARARLAWRMVFAFNLFPRHSPCSMLCCFHGIPVLMPAEWVTTSSFQFQEPPAGCLEARSSLHAPGAARCCTPVGDTFTMPATGGGRGVET